jgi:hypothetical protein
VSRPDAPSAAEPRIPRAPRPVHRRSPAVPLRVVAQRLSPEEADRLARHPGPPGSPAPSFPQPATAWAAPATAWASPAAGAATALAPRPSGVVERRAPSERALPVLDRRRRRPFARLLALVRARRRVEAGGRHRPGTTSPQGWSMFAPHRRSRGRFGARR